MVHVLSSSMVERFSVIQYYPNWFWKPPTLLFSGYWGTYLGVKLPVCMKLATSICTTFSKPTWHDNHNAKNNYNNYTSWAMCTISHSVSEKVNQWKITNHLSASYVGLFNSRINAFPWKYSNWRMFIEVKALWLWLYCGWLLPGHHLCLLCSCFTVTSLPNRPT
jgi:hypothetical protein